MRGYAPKATHSRLGFVLQLALLALLLVLAPSVLAQDEATQPVAEQLGSEDGIAIELEDIVVIGTRVRGVAPENLSVPVDFYDIEEMTATGTSDLAVALQQVAPSFNSQRNALGDGGLFHSALLRGMTPNHTLVLINGKRRHSISFPRPLETALQGTTGVDLRAIPIAAIERIEVLRHGAVSQYGADAVGGVINIVLKENAAESTASAEAGVTGEGDGERYGAAANIGLPLGDKGALNLTLELFDQGRTDRAFESSHLDLNGPNAPSIERKVVLGEPEYDVKALFLNAAVPLEGDAGELYVFGGWSQRNGLSSGAWRDPIWAQDRMVAPVHPDGFLPFEKSTSEDIAATAGFRSEINKWNYDLSLSYGANTFDFGAIDSINASWAARWLQRQLDQGHVLASITPDDVIANAGPRSGDSGGTKLETWSLDAETTGEFKIGMRTINAAFGAGYRQERFHIRAGDFASWGCGLPEDRGEAPAVILDSDGNVAQLPATDDDGNIILDDDGDVTYSLARCGHQGYPGYSPINAQFSERDRPGYSAWADFHHDVTSAWSLETAIRWEQYEDAGDSVTGMLGSRLDLSSAVSLRATASTGFRAPNLPELGFNTIIFSGGGSEGLSVTAVLEDGAVNQFFGRGPADLQHETSSSLIGGIVLTPHPDVTISADAFWISLEDRITSTVYEPECDGADAAGCTALLAERQLPRITNIQYRDNLVDTRTTGLDVVARYDSALLTGDLTLTGALHFNETEITAGRELIGSATQSYIEEGNPKQRHRVAADWMGDALDLHLGLNYYGETASQWLAFGPDCPGEASAAWITNVSAGWRFKGVRLSIGVDNAFDEYPDTVSKEIGTGDVTRNSDTGIATRSCFDDLNDVLGWGQKHNPDVPYGLSGRIFWTRLDARF